MLCWCVCSRYNSVQSSPTRSGLILPCWVGPKPPHRFCLTSCAPAPGQEVALNPCRRYSWALRNPQLSHWFSTKLCALSHSLRGPEELLSPKTSPRNQRNPGKLNAMASHWQPIRQCLSRVQNASRFIPTHPGQGWEKRNQTLLPLPSSSPICFLLVILPGEKWGTGTLPVNVSSFFPSLVSG